MEDNRKPDYQPWNEEEFQADVFVRGMNWMQKHFYRALLQAAFFHSTRPYLPADDEVLWVLAGAESQEQWEQNKSKVIKRFTAVEGHSELIENRRVTADWQYLMSFRDAVVEQGAAGGRKSAEVRRTKYGTAQPFRPVTLVVEPSSNGPSAESPNGSNGPSKVFDENSSNTEAREVKVSEVKEREENQSGASAAVLSSSKKQQGDWKSIAIRHKNVFGKQASVKFKDKFYEACAQYGEDVVLECFDAWATGAKDWVEANGVDQPLFSFFKKLPAEAENIVEINEAVQEEKTLAVQQKQREEQMQAASTERQCKENADRFAVKERVGVESVDDFLKG